MKMHKILRDTRAAGAMEFALVAPAFIILIMGIAQLGIIFFANAGLHNAVAQGARLATIFPRPSATDVAAQINAAEFGLNPAGLADPTVDYNVTSSPNFADIQMSYTTTLNFIVYRVPITLRQSRRVYLQPLPDS